MVIVAYANSTHFVHLKKKKKLNDLNVLVSPHWPNGFTFTLNS